MRAGSATITTDTLAITEATEAAGSAFITYRASADAFNAQVRKVNDGKASSRTLGRFEKRFDADQSSYRFAVRDVEIAVRVANPGADEVDIQEAARSLV